LVLANRDKIGVDSGILLLTVEIKLDDGRLKSKQTVTEHAQETRIYHSRADAGYINHSRM
jgi:hypothetical protein